MFEIKHNDTGTKGEFYIGEDGHHLAEMTYSWAGEDKFIIDHTWVDDSLRGQGVARQLLDVLVEFAREKNLKILPTCSYVEVMFRRDESFADVKV